MYSFSFGKEEEIEEPICENQMAYMTMFGIPSLISQGLSAMIVIQSYVARAGFI